MFRSDVLAEAGLYPRKTKDQRSRTALRQRQSFSSARRSSKPTGANLGDWFDAHSRTDKYRSVEVIEHFLPIPIMETLVVLLTVDYDALFLSEPGGEGYDDEDDELWTKERHDRGD
jgi:hypothetical protein